MLLLALSTLLDYLYGFYVASPNRKKAKIFLWLSIINNLGILGVFVRRQTKVDFSLRSVSCFCECIISFFSVQSLAVFIFS